MATRTTKKTQQSGQPELILAIKALASEKDISEDLLFNAIDDLGINGTGIPVIQMNHKIPPSNCIDCTICASTVSITDDTVRVNKAKFKISLGFL